MAELYYCKVYVDTSWKREGLRDLIAEILNGTIEISTVLVSGSEIDVRHNNDYIEDERKEFPDGFLHFRYYLDIESTAVDAQKYLLSELLRQLWARGIPAVASCDYERELPENGGYKSRSIPWPK